MGMDVALKILWEGILPASKTTLYTVPANKSAVAKSMHFKNTTGADKGIGIFIKRATSRKISQDTLKAGDLLVGDESISLEAGDSIEGSCDDNTSVEGVISGIENTIPL